MHFEKALEISDENWLWQEHRDSYLTELVYLTLKRRASADKWRPDFSVPAELVDLEGRLVAVHDGHIKVHENRLEGARAALRALRVRARDELLQRDLPVRRKFGPELELLHDITHHYYVEVVVIDAHDIDTARAVEDAEEKTVVLLQGVDGGAQLLRPAVGDVI